MRAHNVNSFVMEKQGQYLDQAGQYGDHEERHNQYDSWTLQLGLDKDIGDNWQMEARVQRGSTDRFTKVFNEIRVDREMLAIDAVEVYTDRRDLTGERRRRSRSPRSPDAFAARAPSSATFSATTRRPHSCRRRSRTFACRPPQGDDSLGNGNPTDLVPIPSPVGPDAIPNCVPMNIFGTGNVSQAAADYAVSPKWGDSAVTQEFAEVLFTGDIWDGFGPGAFSMAVGGTWREQWFWQRGQPQDLMAYGPPKQAPNLGIRGVQGGFSNGSPNLHEFSTVPTINGGYDVWEVFTEFNMPLFAVRFERTAVGARRRRPLLRLLDVRRNQLVEDRHQLPGVDFLRFRTTVSRDVREATFAERYDVQGGGGSIQERARR